jgi:hypothetical protein
MGRKTSSANWHEQAENFKAEAERFPYGVREASVAEAGTKGRATSNPASRFLLLSVRSVALSALPFVLWKPVEIGESGTRELFSLALTGLQHPLQMALK